MGIQDDPQLLNCWWGTGLVLSENWCPSETMQERVTAEQATPRAEFVGQLESKVWGPPV